MRDLTFHSQKLQRAKSEQDIKGTSTMFTNKEPASESWSDFNEKFGRTGTSTKLLESFSSLVVTRSNSHCRVLPSKSKSFSAENRGGLLTRSTSSSRSSLARSNSGSGRNLMLARSASCKVGIGKSTVAKSA
jgi:hypothetical protein